MVRTLCLISPLGRVLALLLTSTILACVPAGADQVETRNGDRYIGKVISLTADTLVLQSEVAGTLRLPRSKISLIHLGTNPSFHSAANRSNAPAGSITTNALPRAGSAEGDLLLPGLQGQSPTALLEGASPEARAKFNQMVAGLLSGKLTAEDIRKEARTVANQVRALRADLGEEAGDALDSYLAILDRFIGEPGDASPARPANPQAPPRAQ